MLRSVHIVLDSYVWEGSEVGVLAVLTVGQSPAKINEYFTAICGSVLDPTPASLCHRDE